MKNNVLRLVFITIVSSGLSAQMLQHEVEVGETLYGIARRYDMSLERLAEVNKLESPELLLPGTLLTIPTRYTVEKGDTLFSIARRFQSSVEELTRYNELSSPSIRVGQTLRLSNSMVKDDSTVRDTSSTDRAERREDQELDPDEPPQPVEQIAVAAEVSDPLNYADGGVWPVAGNEERWTANYRE